MALALHNERATIWAIEFEVYVQGVNGLCLPVGQRDTHSKGRARESIGTRGFIAAAATNKAIKR